MLPSLFRNFFYSLFIFALFFVTTAHAQTDINALSAQDMIKNITAAIPNFMRMVTAIAYVLGMYFIISGIWKMKHLGEMRTQMSHEHSLKGPVIALTVGALLLYLPSSVQVGMSTFWANPNPYGYIQEIDQWSDFINDCFLIIQFIGTVAFIRGLVLLSHLGGTSGASQGTFAKGLTHIIGGIFCINIYQFVQVVMVTLGIQT